MNSNTQQQQAFLPRLDVFLHNSLDCLLRLQQYVAQQRAEQQLRKGVQQERQRLAELPDYLLKDIGISRETAVRESQKTAMDIPATRLRSY